jgi:predicted nucleic acid-binding protein
VVVPPLVVAELVSAATFRGDARKVADLVGDLELVGTPREHWIRVGELRRRLLARGLSVSTPDAHVAQCALDLDALLRSRDAIFQVARSSTAGPAKGVTCVAAGPRAR